MSVKIPKRLEDHLRREDFWYTCVTSLKARVETFLSQTPEFFPDYTVHGVDHINAVLDAADKLILSEAIDYDDDAEKDAGSGILEPMDVAYLVCAILIHDLGMFLRRDGVRKIINDNHVRTHIKGLQDKAWKATWKSYADRTKRFSAEKMRYHFGKILAITEDCVNKEPLDDDDKRVIGEFLRQNHGRLAHEIAVKVLPGSEDIDLFANTGLTDSDRDLIGLLARSHVMNIRDTEAYLKSNFEDGPMPENTPIFFLMAVLRIADYLDAGRHRAPKLLEDNQKISVPVSVEEWAWNNCILARKCQWKLKSRNRYIYAEPKSSVEYVQLDKWLKSVQAELDLSWSILAEQYPNGYRLSIHRVSSRIYQPDYRRKLNETFLTEEVKVTANPEITRLMIDPLYGSDPSYGVRELLQNAVDACLERKDKDPNHKGLVTVRIDPWVDPDTGKDLGVFTIEDNGVGMDAHVLMNYYLSAGASYRSSEEWKLDYTEDGKSRVARTGRFGVGFLAAFLLGDTVSVTTMHMNEEANGDDAKGYTFEFTNKAKPLNISRVQREQGPGTTIRIVLNPGVLEKLDDEDAFMLWYDWYAFDDPEVRYFRNGKPVEFSGVSLCRDPARNLEWLSMDPEPFEFYQWKPFTDDRAPVFYANGIRVYGVRTSSTLKRDGLDFSFPDVSVIDPNAGLDIDLARARLQTFPKEEALLREVYRYYIARLLLTPWEREEDYRRNFALGFWLRPSYDWGRASYLVSRNGFALNYASVLSAMELAQYTILYYDGGRAGDAIDAAYAFLPSHLPIAIALACEESGPYWEELRSSFIGYAICDACDFAKRIVSGPRGLFNNSAIRYDIGDSHRYLQVSEQVPVDVASDSRGGVYQNRGRHGAMRLFESAAAHPVAAVEPPVVLNDENAALFPVIMQITVDKQEYDFRDYGNPNLPFPRLLRELLGPNEAHPDRDMWIPFDMEERKRKFPEAFDELKKYIDYIRRNPTP